MNIAKAWNDTLLALSATSQHAHALVFGIHPVSFKDGALTIRAGHEREIIGIQQVSAEILRAASYYFEGVKALEVTAPEPEPAQQEIFVVRTDFSTPAGLWQAVLGQLENEMPKASFDTWVRDTQVNSFANGVMVIGVRNAYACEWLESRMNSSISRLVSQFAGRDVIVEFAVAGEVTSGDVENSEDAGEEETSGGMILEPLDVTRYQQIVQPDRVVMLPGYARRLLEQGDMTPKEMSLWVGFRQALYLNWKKGIGTVKNIPYWEAARFAMMSKPSYFREINPQKRIEENGKEYVAGGMVEIIPEPEIKPGKGNARFDNANRYRVQMSPRLTRHDCSVIEDILNAKASMAATKPEAHDLVLAGLQEFASRNPAEYLDEPAESGKSWPRSIQEIVRRVLGIEGDMPQDLADASEKATDRILGAFGKIFISHYFLRVTAPTLHLTHPQAWAIILLKSRRWYDHERDVQYDFTIVPGGIGTVAKWVNVSAESVGDWLKKPEFSAFVHLADMSKLDNIPDTWRENRTAVFLVHPLEADFDTEEPEKRDTATGKMIHGSRKNDTHLPEKRYTVIGKMIHDLRKNDTRLNRLINPLIDSITPNKTQKDSTSGEKAQGAENVPSAWVLDRILNLNKTHPKTQKAVRGGDPNALISWMLYGALFAENPYNYALSRLASSPDSGASDEYDALAALSPRDFVFEIQKAISGNTSAEWVSVAPNREAGIKILRSLLGKNTPISLSHETISERVVYSPSGMQRTVKKVIKDF